MTVLCANPAKIAHPGVTARRFCILFAAANALSACGTMDYSFRHDNFNRETRKSDMLAQVNYTSEGERDPYSVELARDRLHRGYAINAPIHDDGEGIKTNFTVSRTKEYRWFSGLQLSFAF